MIQHITAIWRFRHFLVALVRLDLRLRYRRSILGVGWSLLNPLAMTLVFTLVFSNLLGADARTYAPFLLCGMAIWAFLQQSAVAGSRAFIANEAYIRQSPLPYTIYPLRTVLGQAIHSSIALLVVIGFVVVLQESVTPLRSVWMILPGLVMALLAAWGLATIFAFVNVYFQDTAHLLEVGSQILFFLTPILYPRAVLDNKGLSWLVDLNPVTLFMDLIRSPLLTGELPATSAYLSAAVFTTALIGLAAGTTAWLQKKVIFHL